MDGFKDRGRPRANAGLQLNARSRCLGSIRIPDACYPVYAFPTSAAALLIWARFCRKPLCDGRAVRRIARLPMTNKVVDLRVAIGDYGHHAGLTEDALSPAGYRLNRVKVQPIIAAF